jgi:hypothetical protein
MVSGWRVEEGEETGSDHCLIRFDISNPSLGASIDTHPWGGSKPPLRWARKRLDKDLLMAAAIVKAWTEEMSSPVDDTEEGASRLRGLLTDVCDAAIPQIR